jgi:hypothetical protein
MAINSHFQEFRAPGSGTWWEEVNNYCLREGKGGWNARMDAQLLPIHLVAYMLLPQHHDVILMGVFATQVDNFILEKLGIKGFHEFYQYKKKQGNFHPLNACWTHFSTNATPFWELAVSNQFISSSAS